MGGSVDGCGGGALHGEPRAWLRRIAPRGAGASVQFVGDCICTYERSWPVPVAYKVVSLLKFTWGEDEGSSLARPPQLTLATETA